MDTLVTISLLVGLYLVIKWLCRKLVVGDYDKRYVFITGCDTGFGRLLAVRLDNMGFHVFAACLTESGEDQLRKAASQRLVTLPLDVTNEKSIRSAFDFVKSKLPAGKGLWGVVNNAGVAGSVGLVEWLRKEDYERTLAVNMYGVMETTRVFLPLIRQARGRVVNMASILATVSSPGAAPYCISKRGVEIFSDCLRSHSRSYGVTVHIIEPGYFSTGIAAPDKITASLQQTFDRVDPETRAFFGEDFVSKMDTTSFLNLVTSDSLHKVVDAYTHALTARWPQYRYRVGWDANTLFRVIQWGPEWLSDYLLGRHIPQPKGAQ